MDQITSGIEGFDKLLYGGFPRGRAFLVSGEPGTGKTIFTLQFLIEGLKAGEKAVYISIDEKPEHVIQDTKALGWDLAPYLESGALQILDVTSYFGIPEIGGDHGINVKQIVHDMSDFVAKAGASRLAIDPIAPLIFTEKNVPEVADYIRKMIFSIEETLGCTTLLTSYVPVGSERLSQHGIEEFAASGIILLRLMKSNHKYVRTICVRKMRGTQIDLTEYGFEILPSRGVVLRQPLQ
ncbi:MAG: circadian clock protein KaiC [Candidatus Marinamargulisbacteria bacterium]